jgi:antibiotic biosynthesis monooxygenase (ABM) superfamily enzyme
VSEENIDDNNDKHLLPVTVIVKRIAKKNKIKEFEEWLSGISKEVSRQEGSMGIDIIRPTDKESKPEYIIIFRFNNYDNLTRAWENSSTRNEWLQRGRELVQTDPDVQKLTGLEFWFTPYSTKSSSLVPLIPPPRYKMVIVTIPVISFLLLTLVPQIHFVTEMLFIPYSIRFVIAITITVILMTYLIMPLLTKLLRPRLFNT